MVDFWQAKGHTKLNCPLCRREIKMILINFDHSNLGDQDIEKKRIVENIKTYNANFSNHPRTVIDFESK
jgi:hypothetical protein